MPKGFKAKFLIITVFLLILMFFIFHIPRVKPVMAKKTNQIRIMSYNLRFAASDYEMWEKRKGKLIDQILRYKPDSLGIQEGDYGWMSEYGGLPELLKGYSYVGVGRDDGETLGEYAAIFYLDEKYDVIKNGDFWISETPDIPSKGWDAVANRICTWVTLRSKENGEVYTHFNTHLDHVGKQARIEGIKLLLDKISECQTPFVLTGDFNLMQDSKDYRTIIESDLLLDSKLVAEDTMSHGTINWFLPLNFRYFKPIDFCFVSKDYIKVYKYRIDNSYWVDGRPVSDHYPIVVDLEIIE